MTKPTTDGREIRVAGTIGLETRSAGSPLITGYAAVFNTETRIGDWFREQIAPGAFRAAILRDDVRALINHDWNLILGRSTAGTLRLAEDDRGLKIEIDPPDTQAARDLIVSMERGDISQMSFGFRAVKQTWDESQNPPLRTINECELFDVSVVGLPAYPETEASVSARRTFDAWAAERTSAAAAIGRRLRMKYGCDSRQLSRLHG